MARTSRENMKSSSFFHIMVQGINKEKIFETKESKEQYEKLILKFNEGVEIISYCIMDNHTHVLIQTKKVEFIEKWMKKVNTIFAMNYNKSNNRIGYVFRDRYKLQPIMNLNHLYLCAEYIHNNPVKAKICKDKKEYEYSGFVKIYQGNQMFLMNRISQILKEVIDVKENKQNDRFDFMDEDNKNKEEICNEIINEYLKDKNLSLEEIKKDKKELKEIVRHLKEDEKISFRMMENKLKIGRETLRKLLV